MLHHLETPSAKYLQERGIGIKVDGKLTKVTMPFRYRVETLEMHPLVEPIEVECQIEFRLVWQEGHYIITQAELYKDGRQFRHYHTTRHNTCWGDYATTLHTARITDIQQLEVVRDGCEFTLRNIGEDWKGSIREAILMSDIDEKLSPPLEIDVRTKDSTVRVFGSSDEIINILAGLRIEPAPRPIVFEGSEIVEEDI